MISPPRPLTVPSPRGGVPACRDGGGPQRRVRAPSPLAARLALTLVTALLAACTPPAGPTGDAAAVALVRAAREAHGSDRLNGHTLHFTFRGDAFTTWTDGGRFRHTRTSRDSLGREVVLTVDNDGVARTVGGLDAPFADAAERLAAAESVGSVVYFVRLPAPLTDPAVRVRSLGPDTVAGAPYDALEVTFAQAGGGRDWQDRYVYWLHPERRTVDYLAYSYRETPGDTARAATGHRFRRVIGVQTVDGPGGPGQALRVQDYENLSADSLARLDDYPDALAAGRTFRVSEVRTENVRFD